MGVLERVRTLMASGVQELVEGAQDAGRALRRAVLECEELLRELAATSARSRRYADHLSERTERARRRADQWAARAEDAVGAGSDDLARAALRRRWEFLDQQTQLQQERARVLEEAKQLDRQRLALHERLTELKHRHAALAGPAWTRPEPPAADARTADRVEEELRRLKCRLAGDAEELSERRP